jgi:hypothetical protein
MMALWDNNLAAGGRETFLGRITSFAQTADRFVSGHRRAAIAIVLLLVTGVFLASMRPYWNFSFDGHQYAGAARNLAQGKGLTMYGTAFRWQPPFLSIYWAPAFLVPFSPLVVQLLQMAAMVATSLLSYMMVRGRVSEGAALFVAAIVGLNTKLVLNAVGCLSEAPFMALSIGALCAAAVVFDGRRTRWPMVMVAAVLSACAAQTRSVGVLLPVAFGLAAVFSKHGAWRGKLAAVVVVATVAYVPYVAWHNYNSHQPRITLQSFPNYPDNLEELLGSNKAASRGAPLLASLSNCASELWRRVTTYGPLRVEQCLPAMVAPLKDMSNRSGGLAWWGYLLCAPWMAAILWGWGRRLKSHASAAEFYFALYLALLVLWPGDEHGRLLLPIVPLAWYYLLSVFGKYADRTGDAPSAQAPWHKSTALLAVVTAVSLVAASAAITTYCGIGMDRRVKAIAAMDGDMRAIAQTLAARTDVPPEETRLFMQRGTSGYVLGFYADRPLVLLDDHQAIDNAYHLDEAYIGKTLTDLWNQGVRLVVVDFGSRHPVTPPKTLPGASAKQWKLVQRSGLLFLYERIGTPSSRPAATEQVG